MTTPLHPDRLVASPIGPQSLEADSISPVSAALLRSVSPARIFQRRTGSSLATTELLSFQLDHGRARDAVHASLDTAGLAQEITHLIAARAPVLRLHSAARDRREFLQRPDLGRTLSQASLVALQTIPADSSAPGTLRLSIVIADGLSAIAVERNVLPLLAALLPLLPHAGWHLLPVSIVEQGRVAIGDPIGQQLAADLALVCIGERPGLSSPDSLGAYLTWHPQPGRCDAERNCISNIRSGGLAPEQAANRIAALLSAAASLQLTGVALKESSSSLGGGQ